MKIKRGTIEDLCDAARNVYPNEFIAMIGSKEKNGVIDEIVVLPATYGKHFSSIRIDLMPLDDSVMGSVHSHPTRNNFPSGADLRVFKKTGQIHLIIAYPFTFGSIGVFDANGKPQKIEVVE